MKVHLTTATIAIYFLFTLFVFTLYTNASQEKNENFYSSPNREKRVKILGQKWKTFSRLLLAELQIRIPKNLYPLTKCNIFRNVNQFLTIKDIFILQKTCRVFQNLLQKNCENMVDFRNYADSDQIIHTTIIWNDLQYFLKESYRGFNDMEMFNIKVNEYAVLTRPPENKIIVWNNRITPYPQILRNQAIKNTQPANQQNYFSNNDVKQSKIFNKNETAWVIITNEGNVTAAGNENQGGKIPYNIKTQINRLESLPLQNRNNAQLLKNVKMIVPTVAAFVALLNDGFVVSWGDPDYGGKFPDNIQSQLKNVKMIICEYHGTVWAALLNDGRVICWRNPKFAGYDVPDDIQAQLKNVKMIFSNSGAFAALLNDDSVICWGSGGKISGNIPTQLKNVKMIVSTCHAFAALLNDGLVVSWGNPDYGGKIPEDIKIQLKNVKMMFSTFYAFAALLNDGTVLAWGDEEYGGTIPHDIQSQLQNVKMIIPTKHIFTALLNDGKQCTWPHNYNI